MSKLLVDALERIATAVDVSRALSTDDELYGCPSCGESSEESAEAIDHERDCAQLIAREALAAHRASSLVDDAELVRARSGLNGVLIIAREAYEEGYLHQDAWAAVRDAALAGLGIDHLGRGQR